MRVLRVVGLYLLLFFICSLVAPALLPAKMVPVTVLVLPVLLTWWRVKVLRRRRLDQTSSAPESPEPVSAAGYGSPLPPAVSRAVARQNTAEVDRVRHGGKTPSAVPQAVRPPVWVPGGESATVAGRDIGGLVYVGRAPSVETGYGSIQALRAYIDPSLTVAGQARDRTGAQLPYWPSYSGISPTCRATYLDWLAGGRRDPSYGVGYVFLYFYGLERRFFIDRPGPAEQQAIIAEVARLNEVYGGNASVRRYLGAFLDAAPCAGGDCVPPEQPPFGLPGWTVPLPVRLAIGVMTAADQPLTADWLLSWFLHHPERSLRTPAERCPEEFRALFRQGFDARFPSGLKLNRPRKTLTVLYEAASGEFTSDLSPRVNGKPVPDVSGLRKGIEIAQELAEEAMAGLEKYSRFLGRNPDGRNSVEAHALLPASLWDLFPSEGMESLKAWAQERILSGGPVPLVDVITRLEGRTPVAVSKRQLTDAADALGRIGVGLAPDPRFALRGPKREEPVVLFALEAPVTRLEDVSDAYRRTLLELALGVFVAHADGQVSGQERTALETLIRRAVGLNTAERLRLNANLDWLLAVPPDLPLLRKKMKDMTADQQAAVRAAIVAIAHADTVMDAAEVADIERLYKAMGLDPSLVYSDLHAGVAPAGPVTVMAAEPQPEGERIPTEGAVAADLPQGGTPRLDAARIAAIQQDTARVSSVLGQIFATPEDIEEEEGSDTAPPVTGWRGLDPKHTALLQELLEHDHWTEDAFAALARGYGLMVAGVLETLNEWAFDQYGEALLDDYDGYEVAEAVAGPLRAELQGEPV